MMIKRLFWLIPTGMAMGFLGGCQSLVGDARSASGLQTANVDMSDYFEARLAAGRAYLSRGQVTHAITAFRQAAYSSDLAAEAHNGMAVAYARLGRTDLAEQYFTMAIAEDPSDERFARNFARLGLVAGQEAPTERAMAEDSQSQLPERSPDHTAIASPGAAPAVSVPQTAPADTSSAMVRVSSREVRLQRGAAIQRQPTVLVTRGRTSSEAVASNQFARNSSVRVEPRPKKIAPEYPIRIALASSVQGPRYPVRIKLPAPR